MTTANTNAAAEVTGTTTAPAAAPAAPKAPSKMDKARELYVKLKDADYTVPEGSSIRKEFISAAIANIGLTKNGAITYYNNLQNEAKGKPLYIKPAAKATVAGVQGAEAQVIQTDETKAGDAQANAALVGGEVAETEETQPAE